MNSILFSFFQLITLVPTIIVVVLVIYALILAIKALRIYINKNS